jgi:hypothetical protein
MKRRPNEVKEVATTCVDMTMIVILWWCWVLMCWLLIDGFLFSEKVIRKRDSLTGIRHSQSPTGLCWCD